MEDEKLLMVLNIESNEVELIEKLSNLSSELHHSKKQSIEGGITSTVILVLVVKYILPQIKEIIIEFLKNNRISSLKIGDTEIKNVKERTLLEMFSKIVVNKKVEEDEK